MADTKVSTLGYAVLGLLAEGKMSGYDLKLRMAEPVGNFWHANHSQIYPELSRLEGAGLVTYSVVPQDGKPDKKVYEVTDSGLRAVREWVSRPSRMGPTRDEATLKAYLSWLGDAEATAETFRERAQAHEERLRGYEKTEAWMRDAWGDLEHLPPRKFAAYAALRRGIGYERENIKWCLWVADRLEKMGETPG